ncbi:MAG: DUF1905 domain-containing protein [Chitinophagales bacterium]|nr:DUF1905 domain-containing protein [Chitinophagales bacterium]
MVQFTTVIQKFEKQGEKTGWTYITIPAEVAKKLNPKQKTSFPVKGKLDNYIFKQVALLPMGGGDFIMPLKAEIRKAIGKRSGYSVNVKLELDTTPFQFSEDFIECLNDEPKALAHFKSMPLSHQKYYSKWIDTAKTIETKSKRIVMAVKSLAIKQDFGEMLRENKKNTLK